MIRSIILSSRSPEPPSPWTQRENRLHGPIDRLINPMVSLASPYTLEMAMERVGGGGGNLEDGVALQLALELSRLNVNSQEGPLPPSPSVGGIPLVAGMNGAAMGSANGGEAIIFDDTRSMPRIKSNNTTECVAVPSSEHVAEIVGRQGCKIKALRAKTNTYIKTPVRGEDPVFVVTGRREDVAMAKREILAAAEHFSQIRATRKASTSQSPPLASPAFGSNPGVAGVGSGFANGASVGGAGAGGNGENQVTIKVRVPYRVVGLVVGPKGATIKRIQQLTNTYIITPSRDKEPCFEVTGTPENAEIAKREIESYIALRTGGSVDGSSDDGVDYPLSPSSTDFNGPLTPDPIYTSAAHHFSTIREAQLNNRSSHFGRGGGDSGSNGNGSQGGNSSGGIFFRSKSPSSSSSQNFGPFSSHPYKSASGSGLHGLDDGFAVNGFDTAYDPRPPPASSIWAYGNRGGSGGFGSENSAFGPPRRNLQHQQTFDESLHSGGSGGVIGGRGRPAFGRAVSEPFGSGLNLGLMPLGPNPGLDIGSLSEIPGLKNNGGSQGSGSVGPSSGASSRQSPTDGGSSGKGKECTGCGVRQIVAAFVPCGHNLWCMECAESIRDEQQVCPLCQKEVASVLRIIHS